MSNMTATPLTDAIINLQTEIAELREAVSSLANVAKVAKERLDWWDKGVADPNCIFYQCEDDKDTKKMRAALAKLNPVARAAMETKP